MFPIVALVVSPWLVPPAPSLADLNLWIKQKDVVKLQQVTDVPADAINPWPVLRVGGAYGTGRFGWKAEESGGYVVVTTKITSEDVGDFVFRRNGDRLTYIPETDSLGARIIRHSFQIEVDPPTKRARIEDKVRLRLAAGGEWMMRFSSVYSIESINDAAGKSVPFRQVGGVVIFPERKVGETTYTLRYSGIVDLPQYAGSISTQEATLTNDYWYPMIGRMPAAYDLKVKVPAGWTAVGQGERLADQKTADGTYARFQMDLPVIYYSLSLGPYRMFSEKRNGRTYSIWSPRLAEADMKLQPRLYQPIFELYERSFGRSPFPRYGALDSPAYGGGALEAYSYATYGGGLPAEDPHEPAHTWWGGVVNNTYLKSFWNESFAVFCEGYFSRNVPLGNIEDRRLAFVSDSSPSPAYDSVSCAEGGAFSGPVASSLGYGKGAKVLQMLEQIIGTKTMVKAMRTWAETHPKGIPGEWEDFERVAKSVAPEAKLDSFFADWLHKPGTATLDVAQPKMEGGELVIPIGFAGRAYDTPISVLLEFPDGKRKFVTVRTNGSSPVRIETPKPSLVVIDPYQQALRKKTGETMPQNLADVLRRWPVTRLKGFGAHAEALRGSTTESALPVDLSNKIIVGNPLQFPELADLAASAGWKLTRTAVTYLGQTVNLEKGGALALVTLPSGKSTVLAVGKFTRRPDTGIAQVALIDDIGRFLAGKSEPKRTGPLSFRL
jgi:hypothetical protein